MHHAYLYLGPLSLLVPLARDARQRFQFTNEHDPDVQVQEYEKFGIEEAREFTTRSAFRSMSGRALFIIGISQINSEAQQALLKLFEEPQQGTIFILLAPHGSIIPTLRSRFLEYPGKLRETPEQNGLARERSGAIRETRAPLRGQGPFGREFLSASYKERSQEITTLLKDEDGVRERVRDFLSALEHGLYLILQSSKGRSDIREGLEDIAKVRSYAGDRSPALKMLLEHLALTLPHIK